MMRHSCHTFAFSAGAGWKWSILFFGALIAALQCSTFAQSYHPGDVLYWTMDGTAPTTATPNFYIVQQPTDTIIPPPVFVGVSTIFTAALYRPSTNQWAPAQRDTVYVQDSPLPITLSLFYATLHEPRTVQFNWQTISEINNYGFELERDGMILPGSFTPGHGTTNETYNYSYTDDLPPIGKVFRYRLEQIDFSGTVSFSQTIIVNALVRLVDMQW